MTDHQLTPPQIFIVNVWSDNLEEQFKEIKKIVKDYPLIAMDTEFPGVVFKPPPVELYNKSIQEQQYKTVACNVDRLKVIQVGFALMNDAGELPDNRVWQFNFHFDLDLDANAKASIDLLKSCNIEFEHHKTRGIRMSDFGSLLTTSGLVCTEDVTWITYHSSYDFAYVLRTMILKPLPLQEVEFVVLVKDLFPVTFDVKLIAEQCAFDRRILEVRTGGLQKLASIVHVPRYGTQHQAGSDALLTGQTYLAIKRRCIKVGEPQGQREWESIQQDVVNNMYGLAKIPTICQTLLYL